MARHGYGPVPRAQAWLLALLGAELAIVQLRQPFPDMALLQHVPTLALLLAAPWLLQRWPLSTAAVAGVVGFLALHTFAARWIYSYVPYDAWAEAVFGRSLSDLFGWHRNHFDRLVHISFGLLLSGPVAEVLARHVRVPPRLASWLAVEFVLAFSGLYEIFEWLLTIVAAGDADAYNGQQGDAWDAQKDMALATIGACVGIGWRMGRMRWRRS